MHVLCKRSHSKEFVVPLGLSYEDRILKRVVINSNGCWIWQKNINADGYGTVRVDHKSWLAHRYSYTAFVGPIPDGLVIDHLCRVRSCCNPDHMEPVSIRTNILRGKHPNIVLHNGNTCAKGHKIIDNNISVRSDGRIRCKMCINESARRRRANAAIARS